MPAILTLQQLINALAELDDEDLLDLRKEIDEELGDREDLDELEGDELEDEDEDEDGI
jgi:hypothetical protein